LSNYSKNKKIKNKKKGGRWQEPKESIEKSDWNISNLLSFPSISFIFLLPLMHRDNCHLVKGIYGTVPNLIFREL
jgi:hypothetical protein